VSDLVSLSFSVLILIGFSSIPISVKSRGLAGGLISFVGTDVGDVGDGGDVEAGPVVDVGIEDDVPDVGLVAAGGATGVAAGVIDVGCGCGTLRGGCVVFMIQAHLGHWITV